MGSRYEDAEAPEFLPLGRTSRPRGQVFLAQGNKRLSSRSPSRVDVYNAVSCLPQTPLSQQPPTRGGGLLTATITVLNVKEEGSGKGQTGVLPCRCPLLFLWRECHWRKFGGGSIHLTGDGLTPPLFHGSSFHGCYCL